MLPTGRSVALDQGATKNPELQDSGLVFFLTEEDDGDDQSPKGEYYTRTNLRCKDTKNIDNFQIFWKIFPASEVSMDKLYNAGDFYNE